MCSGTHWRCRAKARWPEEWLPVKPKHPTSWSHAERFWQAHADSVLAGRLSAQGPGSLSPGRLQHCGRSAHHRWLKRPRESASAPAESTQVAGLSPPPSKGAAQSRPFPRGGRPLLWGCLPRPLDFSAQSSGPLPKCRPLGSPGAQRVSQTFLAVGTTASESKAATVGVGGKLKAGPPPLG